MCARPLFDSMRMDQYYDGKKKFQSIIYSSLDSATEQSYIVKNKLRIAAGAQRLISCER